MEIKKTPEADLEKGRLTFFLMGFAVVLSGFFVILEWQTSVDEYSDWRSFGPVFIENEFIAGNHEEKPAQGVMPKISEPETVYEDYVITDDIQEVETAEDMAVYASYQAPDEIPVSQTGEETVVVADSKPSTEVVVYAEKMPLFPGGQFALIQFFFQNVQYPPAALKKRIQGRVWCSFIVETDGSISNISLEEGVNALLDEEALRVLKNMPAWIPGQTNGENIRVKVYIPIVFKP